MQAAPRLLAAEKQQFRAADATKDRHLKRQYRLQAFACALAACEEAGRSSAATDPTVMNDCAEVRAKIDAFDDDDKNEVETPALQLRISTLEQK